MNMRTFDFDLTPLFRSTVGFDRLPRLMDAALRSDEGALSYPPYNIEQMDEDHYRITMAVAGFRDADLNVTAEDDLLVISGKVSRDEEQRTYLHRGIAGRAFERRFTLADHIRVAGATLSNGLLNVDLVREVPEEMKPRSIKIQAGEAPKVIDSRAA
jgi:molecular chaperone IbpA